MLIRMLTVLSVDQNTKREADADFLSVYHFIGTRNRPETFYHSVNALFELDGMMRYEDIKPDIFDIIVTCRGCTSHPAGHILFEGQTNFRWSRHW